MFIVIKSEHYDCTNLICKKDTLEEAVATVKDSIWQEIAGNTASRTKTAMSLIPAVALSATTLKRTVC